MPKQQTPKLRWSKSEKGSLIGKARVSKNMVVEYVCTNESKDKTKQEWTHMRLIGYREAGTHKHEQAPHDYANKTYVSS